MEDRQPYTVCGIWYEWEDGCQCRRFGAWRPITQNSIGGVIAGYLGGGGYTYEQFYAEFSGKKLTSLRMWDRDYATDEEIEFEELDESIQDICYEAVQKELWEWCSLDQFDEDDSLWLRPDKVEELNRVGKIEIENEENEEGDISQTKVLILGEEHLRLAAKISSYIGI